MENSPVKELGALIRSARKREGMTQLSLGVELGFESSQFISDIERGRFVLPPKHIPRISRALKISQDEIIDHLLRIRAQKIKRSSRDD